MKLTFPGNANTVGVRVVVNIGSWKECGLSNGYRTNLKSIEKVEDSGKSGMIDWKILCKNRSDSVT